MPHPIAWAAGSSLVPLPDPGELFGHIPAVRGWRCEDPGTYVLSVSNPMVAAPQVTRGLVSAGADVLSIGQARHSLEDVYVELIDEDAEARKH